MMTLEDIRAANINAEVAKEALSQADRRLSDTLDTKKAFEQKASTLFNAYISLSVVLFGVGGTTYQAKGLTGPGTAFFVTGLMFMIGALLFVTALRHSDYGALGSSPDMWLQSGRIDGGTSALPLMQAYLVFYHHERITTSVSNNNRKAALIRTGIYIGVIAPIVLALLLVRN